MDDTIRQHKYLLTEDQIPTTWYNIIPDLPVPPPPPLHPGTMEPVGPEDLAPLFPMALIEQEVTSDRFVEIPGVSHWIPEEAPEALARAILDRIAST